MREVAALAGVSIKTVSRVVRGEGGVSPELAARVTDAAAMLDYRHNLAASTLRGHGQKTAAIGLVLMDVANPYASALHRAVEDFAHVRGTLVFAVSSDEHPDRQRECSTPCWRVASTG
jgi:LacI family transcriptional regulator